MSYIQNCFYNFEEIGKDDKNSISNRIKNFKTDKFTNNLKKIRQLENMNKQKNKDTYNYVINSINEFEYNYLKIYKGDLYDILSLLIDCLKVVILEYKNNSFNSLYQHFIELWDNYQSKGTLIEKYQVQHHVIKILRKINKKYKLYLNRNIINKLKDLHYNYYENNIYKKIRKFYYINNISNYFIDEATAININEQELDKNNNESEEVWEEVANKKTRSKSTDSKKHSNNYKYSNINTDNELTEDNDMYKNMITILELNENYIKDNEDTDYVVEYVQNLDLIEPDMEFLEYVDSEPDNDFDSSSEDDNNDYN